MQPVPRSGYLPVYHDSRSPRQSRTHRPVHNRVGGPDARPVGVAGTADTAKPNPRESATGDLLHRPVPTVPTVTTAGGAR